MSLAPGYVVCVLDPSTKAWATPKFYPSDFDAKDYAAARISEGKMVRIFALIEIADSTSGRMWRAHEDTRKAVAGFVAVQLQRRPHPVTSNED